MLSIIFATTVLFNIILNPFVSSISCKDESGSDIPTWTIMKLPKGTDYYYYDANYGYKFSQHSLNDTRTGALAHTMKQLWEEETQYMIYNDEPPNEVTYNFSVAHSKAIWMWDDMSAVLIAHSVPKFPQGPKEQEEYTGLMSNAWMYGQHIACFPISLNALPNTFSLLDETSPLVYETSCNNCYNQFQNETADISLNETIACPTYEIDDKYLMFMKPSEIEVDIWASCIAPYFSSEVAVESWIHGKMDGPYCSPSYPYNTVDIKSLRFPEGQSFTEYHDHSKWGILQSPLVCFGDLNRVTTQMQRAGTVYCWKDETLWTELNQIIVSTNSC